MREYELFYLVGESKEPKLEAIRSEVEALCHAEGAEFLTPETQDKRKLAYEVAGETRGVYVARRFTLPDRSELSATEFESATEQGDILGRINRKLTLSKDVIRSLILRAEGLPELKPIERTEYAKKDPRARGFRRERPMSEPRSASTVPVAKEASKDVSKEEIDAQLKEKLDI